MRVGILTVRQLHSDKPAHLASRNLTVKLLAFRFLGCKPLAVVIKEDHLGPTLVQLVTDESWSDTKFRFRTGKAASKPVYKLLPPSQPLNLDLAYPEANRITSIHPHEAFRRECREVKKQQKHQKRLVAQTPIATVAQIIVRAWA